MVHCSNCTSDINAWVSLFGEFAALAGAKLDTGDLYTLLFKHAFEGDADCGGLLSYNYISGEVITGVDSGRPVFLRSQESRFTLANFMRTHLSSALATLKIGMRILEAEGVKVDSICGHGGYLKTPVVGQTILSAALSTPVTVMETAGEGGPYGMALLAAYMLRGERRSLPDYLDNVAFSTAKKQTLMASDEDIAGFEKFTALYEAGLAVERAAVDNIP
jgi:sugar (pentulose or hexulose) kinase